MAAKIEVPISAEDMAKLQAVANFQSKDVTAIVELAIRLYLRRFNDLTKDED